MTNDGCISFCDNAGLAVAGTEYGGQCFCGDDISSTKLDEAECSMPCTGATNEVCGGSAALSVWKKTATSKFKLERRYTNHLVRHERKMMF
ncbi:hypothetical protein EDD37DRAFT_339263 [Exophiala viscosa]|uniref:uncharacterized protein n=1 Tax=Exophiala viscosa TaxID=2486360 RepID=UPI002194442F|nr:hypothetical protein EDD37DRAFT_339263 [Exophiala viscosa]